ncbi:hypothetical protein FisN_11Hu048 [Fistulifera solaris]|uniref:RING-type domain-containing protein n=1 Tax=Fistulifera solaris TaxID=1519565 RepID=A0A1Z5JL49_FISSO|nr:hypothetical protein FisN_11Hu048 [Fistulifera solaris]|eukprot:GAX14491.1 hypothetical protein FisN_11Hu048 [Fistulifera solaris]
MNSLDILAATFFVVAGAWLIIALVYSYFVIIFLRLRARGELNSIYEEDFGRVYLCGSTRFYISFGGIFRRYIRHIQPEPSPGEQVIQSVKFMTRAERREAMEILLYDSVDKGFSRVENKLEQALPTDGDLELGQASSASNDYLDANPDTTSSQEPVCSICLGEYESDDDILRSKTCPHEFHKECVMDWLQRQINTECPCCRSPMVDEQDVWATVKRQRKFKKKVSRHEVISKVLRKRSDLSDTGRNNTSDGNDSNSSSESTVPESPPRRDLRIESSDASQDLPEP